VTAGYTSLLALAEREQTLIAAGAWDDLAAVAAERDAIVATLPAVPPPEALDILRRLHGAQQLVAAALRAVRLDTARELVELGRGRGAVRGYATAGMQLATVSQALDGTA
jgi:hypothetical protein